MAGDNRVPRDLCSVSSPSKLVRDARQAIHRTAPHAEVHRVEVTASASLFVRSRRYRPSPPLRNVVVIVVVKQRRVAREHEESSLRRNLRYRTT